jgi:phosphoribosyl 1,2-cyclic phosphodiesterase
MIFAGTRGEIDARTKLHRMHTCLWLPGNIWIDCGADWIDRVEELKPRAIILTHAHLDHAGGLKRGAPCSVYATPETWERIKSYPIHHQRVIQVRQPWSIHGITFEAFPVEHSLLAPAVGYRIVEAGVSVFYVPDLVRIHERHQALYGIELYIGDGASITRPIVRRREDASIGHASVQQQLEWCRKEGVPRALMTHCGSQIVEDEHVMSTKVAGLGREHCVDASIAYDGMKLVI